MFVESNTEVVVAEENFEVSRKYPIHYLLVQTSVTVQCEMQKTVSEHEIRVGHNQAQNRDSSVHLTGLKFLPVPQCLSSRSANHIYINDRLHGIHFMASI